MAGTELVPVGDDSPFAVLRMGESDVQELLKDALGGESLSVGDLDRIKVPAGGATSWEVPTLEGEQSMKVIEGIIISRATRRAYWEQAFDERDPDSDGKPDCFSDDGELGVGDPGGSCALCPFNEFESAGNGIGKACKETRQLFVLTAGDLLPFVVTIPPGSLANVKAYFLRLLRAQISPNGVVTKIALEKAESKQKIKFSKVTLTAGEQLDPVAKERIRAYAELLTPAMTRAARVERDEVE